MQRIVEILLIVGILTNVLKGAEILLRPHQQKKVQTFFDHLTLKLEYTSPLKWFGYFLKNKIQVVFITIASLFLLIGYLGILLSDFADLYYERYSDDHSYPADIPIFVITIAVAICIAIWAVPTSIVLIYRGNRVVKWLYAEGNSSIFTKRLFYFWGVPVFFNMVPILGLIPIVPAIILEKILPSILFWIFLFIYALALVIVSGCWSVIGFAAYFTFLAQITCFCLEVLVRLLRAIAWRIVEYNKGAFAAVILLFTVLLGVVETYLKFFKP